MCVYVRVHVCVHVCMCVCVFNSTILEYLSTVHIHVCVCVFNSTILEYLSTVHIRYMSKIVPVLLLPLHVVKTVLPFALHSVL